MATSNTKAGQQTVRPKSASINTREYDEAQMHRRFTDISAAIHARPEEELGFHSVDITPRSLSLLTGNLRQFIEAALGKSADPEHRKITKFPHKLFSDYKPGGALDIMLCACLNFKALHGLRRLEFSNPDKRQLYLDLLQRIEKNLKQAQLLPMVKVFFARSVPTSNQPALRAIVSKRGITVSSASAATHIVYPDPEGSTAKETGGTDYCRTLELNDQFALVHWWYHPDSYDSWIPRSDVDGMPEPVENQRGPWHVQMRWLQDTELYNEWMNVIDYEVPDEMRISVIPAPRAGSSPASVKEKVGKGDSEKSSKKRRRISSSLLEYVPDATSERNAKSAVAAGPDNSDNAALTDDSEDEAIRKPKRHSDNARERKGNDSFKSRKGVIDVQHARKKARTVENRGDEKVAVERSVLVRIQLKPLHERKVRTREKTAERKDGLSGNQEKRETVADANGMKVRVNLGKLKELQRESQDSVFKSPNMAKKEAATDEHSKVKTKARITNAPPIIAEKEDANRSLDERSIKVEVIAGSGKELPKSVDEEDSTSNRVNQEIEKTSKPFSRRRRQKKERRQMMRVDGMTVVEDAVPLPEGEVPRIRNISMEGTVPVSMEKEALMTSENEQEVDGAKAESEKLDRVQVGKPVNTDENEMEVDDDVPNGRTIAVSEKVLSGDGANAPVSSADVVEALPPVAVRIPSQSRWFRLDAIHDIEKRAMTEFFTGQRESKTPLVYKKYRDFMVDVWRQSPDKYLTATAARRHLAGDVCAILRVHAFLEHWGLINYGSEPESKPSLNASMRGRYSRPQPMNLDAKTPDPATGVPRLLFFDDPRAIKRESVTVSLQKAVKSAKEKSLRHRNPVLSRRELYATAAATKYECDSCGKDCSKTRYHCVGNSDLELCPTCFANGEYPEVFSARDFEQLTTVLSSEAYDGTVWSEGEVLLLFEGLEKYGESWSQVADHVGTKSSEQCIQEFLRAPLEDSFLEDQLGNWEDGPGSRNDNTAADRLASGEHKFAGPLLPFHDTANPVMMQVAFLASSVDPEVAAAAAQAALNKIMSSSSRKPAPGEENRSAQAAALLRSSEHKKNPHAVANGVERTQGASKGPDLTSIHATQLDAVAVEAAAAVGLAAAVGKAKHMAEAESRDMEREFAIAVESKLRVVDLKLKELERLDEQSRKERERLAKQRQQVFSERIDAALLRIGNEAQKRVVPTHPLGTALSGAAALSHSVNPYSHRQLTDAVQGQVPSQTTSGQLHQASIPVQHTAMPMQHVSMALGPGTLQAQCQIDQGLQPGISVQHASMGLPHHSIPSPHSMLPVQQGSLNLQMGPMQAARVPLTLQPASLPMHHDSNAAMASSHTIGASSQFGQPQQATPIHPGTIHMPHDGTNTR